MRAWFDVLTPKQVLFFKPIIDALKASGAQVLATSRRYREVGPLAERAGLALDYVGDRGGREPEDQLLAATRRQAELIPMVKGFDPDVAVSVASAVCARIAFGLGVRHVAINDSPHSEVAGKLSIPLSHLVLCPWVVPYKAWERFGVRRRQVTTYRALDPAVWLKRTPLGGPVPDLDERKKTITVRVQETDAPYLAGTNRGWIDGVLESLLRAFPQANLVAICRYDYQVEEIRSKFGTKWIVPTEVVSGHDLLARTDLFVGMGGTMNAEAALMGVPTISAFQGVLYTDRYLQSVGLEGRARTGPALVALARRFIAGPYMERYAKKARQVLDSMEDPVPKISRQIRAAANQA